MSNARKRYVSPKRPDLARRFYRAACAVLACGLSCAILVYLFAADAVPYQLPDSPQDDYQVERIGGQTAVWIVHFNRWFDTLWHGRQLAWTLAMISVAVALLCFLAGRSLSVDMSFGPRGRK